ncbi:carboxymuconolactone decarboxylase family protein [Cohnella nanjingensis]|uniref:Carboxymuconolactone decarboxylase family protein n=1 Tax=Cohnella nanjingensis TaxID=1387779 RepID=A0A7X0VD46_9BACL|nr:carboxymuconolactone decarboxylase family protein [Cohnella nanjingensis]MBB6669580.1 carboxymuconolactone decarboxylase family protein [Cohnella nanjingensis]
MQTRFSYHDANPEALQALLALEQFASSRGIEPSLYALIKLRASQINGCAFCVDMHAKDLLKLEGGLDRVVLLPVWREAPCYTDKERAVLDLTEHATRLSEAGVPQPVYERVREFVDEKEFVDIIMAINAINSWNRIGVATGMFPGCAIGGH